MMMVGCRSATAWTIVIECTFVVCTGKLKHICIPSRYLLRLVRGLRHHKMVLEDRVRIDQDIIFMSAFCRERNVHLHIRTMLPAEEALALCEVFLAGLCCR